MHLSPFWKAFDMLRTCLIALTLAASSARADVVDVVQRHALPGYAAFAGATADLAKVAQTTCDAPTLRPAFNAAWDTWLDVSHLHLGPTEQDGRALAIAFWPDPKGLGAKAQTAMIRAEDPAVNDPAAFAQVSVAARGLTGLERLLYPEVPLTGAYPCALIRATATDLADMADAIQTDWTNGFADRLIHPGAPGNAVYLTPAEARQEMLTQLIAGLEFAADTRLGRPLGTFDRPRPERAEARLSGRALHNVTVSLAALRDMSLALSPDSPKTAAAFDRAIALTVSLDDTGLQGVADPQGWLKVEILQQAVHATRDAALAEIGPALGVGIGFNAADGD
jgi:predicted lipoprotein